MEACCVKCRTKKEIKDAQNINLKNGKPATQGVCALHVALRCSESVNPEYN